MAKTVISCYDFKLFATCGDKKTCYCALINAVCKKAIQSENSDDKSLKYCYLPYVFLKIYSVYWSRALLWEQTF